MTKSLTTKERLILMENEIKTTNKELSKQSVEQVKQGAAIQEIREIVLKLPEKLSEKFVSQKVYDLQQKNLDQDVEDLQNDRKWIVRLVLATVVVSMIGLVVNL